VFCRSTPGVSPGDAAESVVDVEEYEDQVMYPEFARRARQAGYPGLATLFMKVAEETCSPVSSARLSPGLLYCCPDRPHVASSPVPP